MTLDSESGLAIPIVGFVGRRKCSDLSDRFPFINAFVTAKLSRRRSSSSDTVGDGVLLRDARVLLLR